MAMASERAKIKVKNPVVEMDGDEVSWSFAHSMPSLDSVNVELVLTGGPFWQWR
jgi:hypothetical protein